MICGVKVRESPSFPTIVVLILCYHSHPRTSSVKLPHSSLPQIWPLFIPRHCCSFPASTLFFSWWASSRSLFFRRSIFGRSHLIQWWCSHLSKYVCISTPSDDRFNFPSLPDLQMRRFLSPGSSLLNPFVPTLSRIVPRSMYDRSPPSCMKGFPEKNVWKIDQTEPFW